MHEELNPVDSVLVPYRALTNISKFIASYAGVLLREAMKITSVFCSHGKTIFAFSSYGNLFPSRKFVTYGEILFFFFFSIENIPLYISFSFVVQNVTSAPIQLQNDVIERHRPLFRR